MAASGPVPKRDAQRRRRNVPAGGAAQVAAAGQAVIPDADPEWHPIAHRWFESLRGSGQSVFYESSDWMTAYLLAESMHRELSLPEPPKAASVAAWLKAMGSLMVLEGDRRRVRLELERQTAADEEAPDVSELADYRRRLRESG